MGRLAAGAVVVVGGVLVGAAPSVATKPKLKPRYVHYTGKATGGLTWQEHRESQDANPTPSLVVDQNGEDKGALTFSFTLDRKTGKVTGKGKGSYTSATYSTPGNSLDYSLKNAGGSALNVSRTSPAPISLSKDSTHTYADEEASRS